MTSDPASLDHLRDIVQPGPVSWWPLASGWWILLAVLASGSMILGACWYRRWRANAYRRAALRELESATTATEISAILKRTALCTFPRSEVAALSGSPWCDWLAETMRQPMPGTVQQSLSVDLYRRQNLERIDELSTFARSWINNHQTANEKVSASGGAEAMSTC